MGGESHCPYSLASFQEFLNYKGVIRVPWKNEDRGTSRTRNDNIIPPIIEDIIGPGLEVGSESSSVSSQENDILNFIPRIDPSHAFDTGSRPKNPDTFYISSIGAPEEYLHPEDDTFYKYFSSGVASDRRYSNNSERNPIPLLNELAKEASATQEEFEGWERHDDITRKEMFPGPSNFSIDSSDCEGSNNGGLYDPFRPGLSEITSSREYLLQLQPAAKYRDLLKLSYIAATTVNGLASSRRYKNNLSAVVQDRQAGDLLVVGCMSEIMVYEFDPCRHIPLTNSTFRFETRPPFTSTADRIVLTWPYYPHTINFLKSSVWKGGTVIGVCTDDGSVLVWDVARIRSEMKKFAKLSESSQSSSESRLYGLRIAPDVNLKMEASAWGLDFAESLDSLGTKHHIIVASSNSQSVTLYYFDQESSEFSTVDSHQLLHNIPEVNVLEYSISGIKHIVIVSCASISGELVLFNFTFTIEEPRSESSVASPWPLRHGRVAFEEPIVIRRTSLDSECWTSKAVQTCFFKPVQSIRAMTGDPSICEDEEVSQILTESRILNLKKPDSASGNLGAAAYWQFFDSPVVHFASSEESTLQVGETSKFASYDEEYRRIHQTYKDFCDPKSLPTHSLQKFILAASTGSRLGLFRADSLICTSATKKIFTLEVPTCNETRWCNRILTTHIIEELLCFIAVSPVGLITIMRLCEHRGLYGMRQEHLFPNAWSLAVAWSTIRTIIGFSVRNMSASNESPRFFLYIVYSDGLILTYELREQVDDLIDIDF